MNYFENPNFWTSAFSWHKSIFPKILGRVLLFVVFSCFVTFFFQLTDLSVELDVGPFEISGTALGLLLVFRVNSGYERWWEGRKLWGSIIGHLRNLAISAIEYGPQNSQWKRDFFAWSIALAYAGKKMLRPNFDLSELSQFLSAREIESLKGFRHSVGIVGQRLAALLRDANQNHGMNGFMFMQLDKERLFLLEQMAACERILRSPPPPILEIKIRSFLVLFLLMVPFSLVDELGWFSPLAMFMITYPLLALDQIGIELQNPFSKNALDHLPLNEFTQNIHKELLLIIQDNLKCDICLSSCTLSEHSTGSDLCQKEIKIQPSFEFKLRQVH